MAARVRPTDRRGLVRSTFIALLAALATFASSVAPAAQVRWHDSFEDGLAAAAESHKPIMVFAFVSQPGGVYDFAHDGMLRETLVDPGVVEASELFEAVRLDVRLRRNDEARRRLKVSPVVSASTGVIDGERVAAYPITLFLDHRGEELFRRHGYLPPAAYRMQLERAANLFHGLNEVTQNPRDAVARRGLGRAYMEMDFAPDDPFYRGAIENLERAISLAPDNVTGANFDARVDLAILRMPDDPAQGLAALSELLDEDERSDRRFEIQYFMAVAHYVQEDLREAVRILARFETDDRDSAYFDSPWTPQALGLLEHLRRRMQDQG